MPLKHVEAPTAKLQPARWRRQHTHGLRAEPSGFESNGADVPVARLPRRMPRRSLRPHLNQIRTWVRQGRTDAWIAHQLEVTVQQIESFKREQGLAPEEDGEGVPAGVDYDDEIDLRAEDDALIAAELEAAEANASDTAGEEDEADEDAANGDGEPRRRRSRRGGRRRRGGGGRRRGGQPLEGTFD